MARLAAIIASSFFLNVAAVIYRPPTDPSVPWKRSIVPYAQEGVTTVIYGLDGTVTA